MDRHSFLRVLLNSRLVRCVMCCFLCGPCTELCGCHSSCFCYNGRKACCVPTSRAQQQHSNAPRWEFESRFLYEVITGAQSPPPVLRSHLILREVVVYLHLVPVIRERCPSFRMPYVLAGTFEYKGRRFRA